MNELKIFENTEFGKVRATEIDGEAWLVGKDVAEILGYTNPRKAIIDHVDDEDKTDGVTIRDSIGREQNPVCINESGLYSLIISSKLPQAKKFKRWVTAEVLPSIRKHGAYMTPQKIEEVLLSPDTIIKLATDLKAEREERMKLQRETEELKPKALFADAVSASKTSILIGDLAKLIKQNGHDIGQRRLFQWMRDKGYLIKQQGASWNMPTQKSMDMGLFEIKETTITHSDGHISISKTVKVSGKGQVYFVNKFIAS